MGPTVFIFFRVELTNRRISTLQQTLEEHKAALKLYQETAEGRVQIFNQITDLLKDCRELKLPIDPNATIPVEDESEKIDIDDKAVVGGSSATVASTAMSNSTSAAGPKLSSMALPFQPQPRTNTSTNPPRGAKSRSSTPPASASLPARPPAGPSSSTSRAAPTRGKANLPSRPSQLRSSTMGGGSLEEGEVGGDEDGEVKERGTKRAAETDRAGRSTRTRK